MRQLRLFGFTLVLGVIALLPPPAAAEPQKEKHAAFDAAVARQLAAVSPPAAALFGQANQARDRGDHAGARDLYARVHEMVPKSSHPLRREGSEERELGHRARAIELLRSALALEESAPNLAALAHALVTPPAGGQVPQADREEAVNLAKRAVQLDPDDFFSQAALAQAAIANDSLDLLDAAVHRLLALEPSEPAGYIFQAAAAGERGDLDAAEASLAEAHTRGFSGEPYLQMQEEIRAARPWYVRYGPAALVFLAAWAAGLLLLLSAGALLSHATLRAAQRTPGQANGEAIGGDLRLRRIYQGVLWLSCVYYWLSIPVVALLVLAAAGGALYAIFAIGQVPIKLVVVIVLVLFATLRAMAKGLFARGRDADPGLRLAPGEEPRLRTLLSEVAAKIGTRPVDNVYLTPGTDLAVMERGGLLRQLRGSSERCLILGVAVLDGMKLGPFKAILAHEYGHFSNRDTAGGGFALGVRRSLGTTALHLAQHGAATWYNPAWLFVLGFQRIFLRVSQGASRLQEILADRWAAFAYGSAAFERGLQHVIDRSIRFNAYANATLGEVIAEKQPLPNLYAYRPSKGPDAAELDQEVHEAIHREPSPYDSHPSPVHRIEWTRALSAAGTTSPEDEEKDVWSLFEDREAVEKRLTQKVREILQANQGIAIPGEPAVAV